MITRLTYGHKSASTLAKMSLEMINEYGADRCEMCNGAFSIINPDKSTIKNCHGVSHTCAYCCQYAYVDDIIVSANTKEEVTKIATYGAALRDKFCYRFKGVDIAGKVYDPSSETLDAAGELSVSERPHLHLRMLHIPPDPPFSSWSDLSTNLLSPKWLQPFQLQFI